MALGATVAKQVLQVRATDGTKDVVPYTPVNQPGRWKRTYPDYTPPLLPQWGDVDPFGIASIDEFLPPVPPELSSEEYLEAVDEVMRLGRLDSVERTPDQTEIALFWADGSGTATPPGTGIESPIRSASKKIPRSHNVPVRWHCSMLP